MATVNVRAPVSATDWPDCWLCSHPFKDGERKRFIARIDIHVHESCYDDGQDGHGDHGEGEVRSRQA